MRLQWSKKARRKVDAVAVYISRTFGEWSSRAFLEEVDEVATLLLRHPNLGPIERFLANEPIMYRSLVVNKLNKIIYTVKNDVIYIVDFWDTRREPSAQATQTTDTNTPA